MSPKLNVNMEFFLDHNKFRVIYSLSFSKSPEKYRVVILILALTLHQGFIIRKEKRMRRYETIFIADPDLQDEARKNLFKKFTTLLTQIGGLLVKIEDWGNRKLAYEIKKKSRGYYLCLTYGGDGDIVKELERNLRLDEKIMKFMTILLEKDIDEEALKQEIASGPEYKVTSLDAVDSDDDSSNDPMDDDDDDDDIDDDLDQEEEE